MDFTLHRPVRFRIDIYPMLAIEILYGLWVWITNNNNNVDNNRSESMKFILAFSAIFLVIIHGCF
jgi:hypothetical protein